MFAASRGFFQVRKNLSCPLRCTVPRPCGLGDFHCGGYDRMAPTRITPTKRVPMFRNLSSLAWLPLLVVPEMTIAQTNAQNDSAAKAAVSAKSLPLITNRTLDVTVDEGTWISLDVSPDGKTILFELLGDLYTLSMSGGTATRITSGQAYDMQPRYSPDGQRIVFVSDRDGAENVWIADANGTNPRALTTTERENYVSPIWTPDSKYVIRPARLYPHITELHSVTMRATCGSMCAAFLAAASRAGRAMKIRIPRCAARRVASRPTRSGSSTGRPAACWCERMSWKARSVQSRALTGATSFTQHVMMHAPRSSCSICRHARIAGW
jgi:hypothetical protein